MDYDSIVAPRIRRLPPYLFKRIDELKYRLRREGKDVIDFGMGNPTDPSPKPVVDKLVEVVRNPRNHRYSASMGIYNLRKEIAKYYKREWDVDLDPATEAVVTIGSKEGLSHLCLAILGAGDTVIVPTPAYPIHIYAAVIAGASTIGIPMEGEEQLLRRIVELMTTLSPKPKVLLLNFPNNPTTKTVSLGFFQEIVAIAKRHGLIVIHDFAYGKTCFDGYRAPSFLQVPGAKEVAVEFGTLSKTFSMAGWRVGYCVGNEAVVKALAKIKGYYDYGIFAPVQIAAIMALRECQEYETRQAQTYQERRDTLCEGLTRIGWPVEKPRASMFVWAPIPEPYRALGSMDFAMKLMQEAYVAVSPGVGFGEDGDGFVRFALIENKPRTQQAIRSIKKALFPHAAVEASKAKRGRRTEKDHERGE
jgi:alanine-synthesizing transaminase